MSIVHRSAELPNVGDLKLFKDSYSTQKTVASSTYYSFAAKMNNKITPPASSSKLRWRRVERPFLDNRCPFSRRLPQEQHRGVHAFLEVIGRHPLRDPRKGPLDGHPVGYQGAHRIGVFLRCIEKWQNAMKLNRPAQAKLARQGRSCR